MLGLAQLVGPDRVRDLISITDKQKAELLEWTQHEPWLEERIQGVIQFRAKVLVHFEKLLAAEAEKRAA